jgi:hypothetical protein
METHLKLFSRNAAHRKQDTADAGRYERKKKKKKKKEKKEEVGL